MVINKKMVIGVAAVIAFLGLILITKTVVTKPKGKKMPAGMQAAKKGAAKAKAAPAKRVISKGKGGLTVKILNSKKTEIPLKVRAFKVIDGRSSVYAASTVGGRMQELAPGTYDIELDTVPQKIFKNIKVAQGRERVENLGCVAGSLTIKTVNGKQVAAYYPIRILYPDTGDMITASMTNKAIEIAPGAYDIEIGTSPRQYKKNIKVEGGREAIVDLGCVAGSVIVKTIDENGRDVRCSVKVSRSDTNEVVSSSVSNRSIELGKGSYNIEVASTPRQSKKDVSVNVGEDTVIEFTVKAPPAPARPAAKAPPAKAKQ